MTLSLNLRRTQARIGGLLIGGALICSGALSGCSTTPRPVAGMAAPSMACTDFNFPIYFEKGSDQLTAAAQQTISYSAARVKGCVIGPVNVLGLADADGPAHRNIVLSRKRADMVAAALAKAGLPSPKFDIEALGESGAVTPSGEPEPLRRRTEVVIHASPPAARS